ncbi:MULTISPECIES: DedA family protein [unclassified Exiguobacterium]|uniref:DedA family protein n=1 Tax=unclassified Exiguobacterium TaxID=2644629 RepID=UPI001BE61611|nr:MULTISPECIES: DedA family protein [unclassified Exiguobacterium]
MNVLEHLLAACGVFSIPIGILIQFIPNELVLAYGGFLVDSHDAPFFLMFLLAWFSFTLSQIALYWIGRYGGRPVALKLYRYFRIRSDKQLRAERWFEKYGAWIVCLSLFWRQLFAVSAGVMRLSFRKFLTVTTLIFAAWSFVFIHVGMMLGNNWRMIGHFMDNVLPFLAFGIGTTLVIRHFRHQPKRMKESA